MFRLMIMCLLALSGVFQKTSATEASSMDMPDMMSMKSEAEDMTLKSKRHNLHHGVPCSLPLQHSGTYLPPAVSVSGHYGAPVAYKKPEIITNYQHVQKMELVGYQKPIIIPSYHHETQVKSVAYQKPVIPKIVYQTIQRPAIHHDIYSHMQPAIKPHVQYVQQPVYSPMVKEQPISYIKSVAPTVSYEHVHKLVTNYVKPVHEIQPAVQTIHPVKTFVKQIPCETHSPKPAPPVFVKTVEKPVMQANSFYSKQYFQPVSYYPKSVSHHVPISVPSSKYLFQKPSPVQTVKVLPAPQPHYDKIHKPQVSYVKLPEPVLQHVYQPMLQYAANYHYHEQPMMNFEPKIHQPILEKKVAAQPVVFVNTEHAAAAVSPQVSHAGYNYQSPIINNHQPCIH